MPKIFNISASNNFVETLAQKLLQDYQGNDLSLAEILILLPNHRACRSLAEAFVRLQGMRPTLLPQIQAIGDVSEEELILKGANGFKEELSIPAAIDSLERTMLFMRLIMGRYAEFGLEKISLSQACFLAQELGNLIDKASLQNLSWDKLASLAPEEYAAHWQETLKFLGIITRYWPEILKERHVIDAAERKNLLIEKQSALWKKQKPTARIIIAGTTAVSPAMKSLVKTVLSLPCGEVYLAGLDKYLEDEDWNKIDETHPQFELKQLLDDLQLPRNAVVDLIPPKNPAREKLISELMRPAASSHKWQNLKGQISADSLNGIAVLECPDTRTEALSIAVLIRQLLETPEKTIALVTPDRTVARRVARELTRWNITVDDSAGIPLAQTPWGIFMRLAFLSVLPDSGKPEILALMKHRLFALGYAKKDLTALIHRLEKNIWRQNAPDTQAQELIDKLHQTALPLIKLLQKSSVSFKDLVRTHTLFAEELATDDILSGDKNLWCGDDGQAGAAFIADILEKADILGEMAPEDYLNLFEALLSGTMVRRSRPGHPRVRILGPMEARLNHFDEIILGGFNEGVWPTSTTADPWMSRPMKRDFGFDLPEKQIGVLGLDFSNLLGAPHVWLTRSQMSDGTQTVKSRWHMRLETVLQALGLSVEILQKPTCCLWAKGLDTPEKFIKITPPAPKPPVSARPRRLSASAFEKLLRDPYGVFAEYILKLKPLEDLEPQAEASDFGNIVHKLLENFGKAYPAEFPNNARDLLMSAGLKLLEESGFAKEKQTFWKPKLIKMIDWIVETELSYRHEISHISIETTGSFFISDLPAGPFEIYARADRIDRTTDGRLNIIDYKTGRARKTTEVAKGYAPQLPIEGLIAESGGFTDIKKASVDSLMYWKLGDSVIRIDKDIDQLLEKTKENIVSTLNKFDFETTGYLSRPNPKHAPEYSDYEHLARVREWSVKEDGEDE